MRPIFWHADSITRGAPGRIEPEELAELDRNAWPI